jgi:glucans biosynthesis protein
MAGAAVAQPVQDDMLAGGLFTFDALAALAERKSREPMQPPAAPLPEALNTLDYDAWRDIRFRPDAALLTGRFRMQLFHPGFLYPRPVTVLVVRDGRATPVAFSEEMFDYGRNKIAAPLPRETGFAGLRLHFALNDPGIMDELAVFLGASYFRFLSRDQRYGLSARGIAVGSGQPGEEFPAFTAFWVDDPPMADERITVHALLEGESLTGAYRFTIWPGAATGVEVDARIYPRRPIERLGIAPLTSMFYVSENDRRIADEFRPEVHDSDGLLLHNGSGEWIWRPLRNPAQPRISSFTDRSPRGFGLLQRERNFIRYEDLEARYDLRPSYWVEPAGDWGEGRIDLVELPGPDETGDNIVAFWVPASTLPQGRETRLSYRIRAIGDGADLHTGGRVRTTFQASARASGARGPGVPGIRRFLVDFVGGDLAYFLREPDRVEAEASVSAGTILRTSVMPNVVTEGFRVALDIQLGEGETSDIRLYLRSGQRALTETWTFPWTRNRP